MVLRGATYGASSDSRNRVSIASNAALRLEASVALSAPLTAKGLSMESARPEPQQTTTMPQIRDKELPRLELSPEGWFLGVSESLNPQPCLFDYLLRWRIGTAMPGHRWMLDSFPRAIEQLQPRPSKPQQLTRHVLCC